MTMPQCWNWKSHLLYSFSFRAGISSTAPPWLWCVQAVTFLRFLVNSGNLRRKRPLPVTEHNHSYHHNMLLLGVWGPITNSHIQRVPKLSIQFEEDTNQHWQTRSTTSENIVLFVDQFDNKLDYLCGTGAAHYQLKLTLKLLGGWAAVGEWSSPLGECWGVSTLKFNCNLNVMK